MSLTLVAQNMPVPTEPVCFNKFPNVICGNGDPIEACAVETQEMDFEVELCMVRAQQQLPAATLPPDAGRCWSPGGWLHRAAAHHPGRGGPVHHGLHRRPR